MIELDFYNHTKEKVSQSLFEKLLPQAYKVLKSEKIIDTDEDFVIEFSLVDEKTIKNLNKNCRGQDTVTDVISLSYFESGAINGLAGEIFICVPFAKKQAEELKHSFKKELEFLFTHGVLHVFGVDHRDEEELKYMEELTGKIVGA